MKTCKLLITPITTWFNDSSLSHLFYSQHSKPEVWQYVNMCTMWSMIQKKNTHKPFFLNCWDKRKAFFLTILNLRNYCNIAYSSQPGIITMHTHQQLKNKTTDLIQPQTVNVHLFKTIKNKFKMDIFIKCTSVNQYKVSSSPFFKQQQKKR